jgi:hypothetical protein
MYKGGEDVGFGGIAFLMGENRLTAYCKFLSPKGRGTPIGEYYFGVFATFGVWVLASMRIWVR